MNKKWLVTGGAGFIGSNFIFHVLEAFPDLEVVNLDALTYAGNLANFRDMPASLAGRHHFVHGDIRDAGLLRSLFSQHAFDAVAHFAAESHVDRSIASPQAFADTNVMGSFRLLEAALAHWRERERPEHFRLLHVSTDEVFGSLGPEGAFSEASPYDPSSPYAASKAASDHFVRAYHRTYGLPCIITNCSNNFGPFQFPEKLIPLMILNILEEKPLPIYGDGENVRDWLYVTDHCQALALILERGLPGRTYCIGGGEQWENIALVRLLCQIMDRKLGRSGSRSSERLITFVPDRPGHDRRYAMDSTRLREELGWRPGHKFSQSLEQTVDWFLEHPDWVNSVRTGEHRQWLDLNYGRRE